MMTQTATPVPLPVISSTAAGNENSALPEAASSFDLLLQEAAQRNTLTPSPTPTSGRERYQSAETNASEEVTSALLVQQLAQWLAQWLTHRQPEHEAAINSSVTQAAAADSGLSPSVATALGTQEHPAALVNLLNQLMTRPETASDDLRALARQLLNHTDARFASLGAETGAAVTGNPPALSALTSLPAALTKEVAQSGNVPLPEVLSHWLKMLGEDPRSAKTENPMTQTQQTPWQKLLTEWSARPLFDQTGTPTSSPLLRAEAVIAPNKGASLALAGDPRRFSSEVLQATAKADAPLAATVTVASANDGGQTLSVAATAIRQEPASVFSRNLTADATLPAQGLASPSRPVSETIQTPIHQTAQWAAETAERIVWYAGRAHEKVELQLTPPNLGKIEVTLQLANDQLTAQFVAASQATREALDQAMPRLRELLQQAGIELGQTSVADHGSGSEQHASQQQPSHSSFRSGQKEENNVIASTPAAPRPTTREGVEVWA